jgi:SAM-dependent methyltransferase
MAEEHRVDAAPPSPERLALGALTAPTLAHYEAHAESFRQGTWDHDVSQNYAALLGAMEGEAPQHILDLGCGPGRDLVHFRDLGYRVSGVDGAPAFVAMARAASGCEVWLQDFIDLSLPVGAFDGIFANASLFHVPRAALAQVLRELHASLKPRGVLFCSNPRGRNEEGMSAGRYGVFHDLPAWRSVVGAAGFDELAHYYRPEGLPRAQQPWLATLWRKR